MKLRIMSDLHVEHDPGFYPKILDGDEDTILVLAGDIHSRDFILDYLDELSNHFRHLIYVPGNHEFYGHSISSVEDAFDRRFRSHEKITILMGGRSTWVDDVVFLGATLWTDFNKGNDIAMYVAQCTMADYSLIQSDKNIRNITPAEIKTLHYRDINYLRETIDIIHGVNLKESIKSVIVTHHLPSFSLIDDRYRGERNNFAYACTDCDDLINESPNLWIYGHTHMTSDRMLGDTRFICNPRGYHPNGLNPDFDPTLTIEL